ncbi:MAG: hypothetical protein C5S45_00075 [Candidatus Methanocomedens sp.]|nr:MAG: hypothetical protein C5S45_00075 [ANME-2 cluster archaeon]
MSENLENIITKGFHSWTRNLNICIPLLINYVVQFTVMFFAAIAAMLLFFGQNLSGMTSMTKDELFDLMSVSIMENLTGVIIIAFLVFLILVLFDAYFFAGAVGMSQNATANGDTSITDMFNAGSSNFINIFLANFLIMLMMIAGIIFVVPGAILTRNYMEVVESTQFTSGILLLLMGIVIWVIYLLVLNVVLAIVLYSIVIERTGAMDGIIRGYEFFMENKLSVFTMWLVIFLLSTVVAVIFFFAGEVIALIGSDGLNMIWSLGSQVLILVTIQPLIVIWWTRLYMVRTGKNIHIDELLTDDWEQSG